MNTSPVRARIHFIRSLSAVTLAVLVALALAAGLILILDRQQPFVARAAGETVQFDAAAYGVNEADGTATITVTLSSDPGTNVTVDYATSGGTASAGSDYTDVSGTLTFTTGSSLIQTFTVSISGDNTYETDETITLTLNNPTAGTVLGANNPATLTILDNETAPTIRLSASAYSRSENAGPVVITATLTGSTAVTATVVYSTTNNTALAGSDYTAISSTVTFTPGVTSRTFTVALINDTAYEGNETFNLGLSAPVSATLVAPTTAVVTILDNETAPTIRLSASAYSLSENAGPAVITATLTGSTAVTATVVYSTTNNTAVAGSDYTAINSTLTFTPGVTSRTFTVALINDTAYEGNETFNLGLSTPVSATLGAPTTAVVTIVNDDPLPTVRLSASAYSLSENAGPAVITATLTGSTEVTATVIYSTTDNTAIAGSDYMPISATLTFSPGVTSRTFAVTVNADAAYENIETFTVTLSVPVSATLVAPTAALVTLFDDDPRPGCAIFNSADVPKTLPDAAPDTTPGQAESTVTLPSPGIVITGASVRIDQLMHTNTPDLSFQLISPDGVPVLIVYRVGSSGSQNFIHTVLADSFSTPIASGAAPFTGNFRPDNPLTAFNGLASGGLWRLRILDNEIVDTGTLNAWGLEVCGSVTAPSYHLYVPLIVR